ncbi:Glycine-rich domain-containing protein 2 [Ananas comosus]|uniref:Glycine-rich domain-containing protein 2 n=1 Tax=Ananas comosus TaxID=4615 RepID=A0A199VXC8_ANACO|nr:Glycine-rich domain-containing protein 2 [Ananas comosus]
MGGENITPNSSSSASSSFSDSSRARSRRSDLSAGAGAAAAPSAAAARGGGAASLDLVSAARRHLSFLSRRPSAASPLPLRRRSLRRYEELWMPLIADLTAAGSWSAAMLLPPLDVHWIWHCHCLDHRGYRDYCASRFGFLIDRPLILDDENEDYAADRCREIWAVRYPSEPFDLEICAVEGGGGEVGDEMLGTVARWESVADLFADPFADETVYLVSAKRRYLDFLDLVKRLGVGVGGGDDGVRLSYPGRYARDMEAMGDGVAAAMEKKVAGFGDLPPPTVAEEEASRRAWEEAYDEPYERAGTVFDPAAAPARAALGWYAAEADANSRYKAMQPSSWGCVDHIILSCECQVCVFLKGEFEEKERLNKNFLRLRTLRCHRSLKLDKPASESSSKNWRKTWHLYCEFGTKGIRVEVRRHRNNCLSSSKLLKTLVFSWNDLLRATTLTLKEKLDIPAWILASITPPVQASYLLKCVPDRVTDDSGAMISDVILEKRAHRPQEGRWLSRTVLDHTGKECFVIRTRVGKGIWRRGAETPMAVKWEERIIEVREGSWSYIASSVGFAPEKVVGTATPKKDDLHEKNVAWCLSTGDVLSIQWEDGLDIQLENDSSTETVKLLRGRRLQYQVKKFIRDEDEDQYFTLVRASESQEGKATALLNWKLLAVEFSPEEDAVLVLLICMAITRTLTEIRREDSAGLLVRRRIREVQKGLKDWGSVMLPLSASSSASAFLQPWYWNASEVLASAEMFDARGPTIKYSPADGKEILYRQAIMP